MVDETTVRTLLESHTTDCEVRGEVGRNDRHAVYEVVVDGRRAVCKVAAGDGASGPLAVETALCDALDGVAAIRTPEVLHAEERFAAFSWLRGEPYDPGRPATDRRARLRALGRSLARLHEATAGWFDGFGTLTVDSGDGTGVRTGVTVDGPEPWGRCWERLVEDWLARLDGTPNEDLKDAVLEAVRRARDDGVFESVTPVLAHADAGPAHVRFGGEDDVGLLDWEGAAAFPPEYDLARARLDWFDLPHAVEDEVPPDALREGCRSVRSLPPGSEARRSLYRATLTAKFVPGGVRAAEEGVIDADPGAFERSLREYVLAQLDRAGRG